MPIWLIKLLSVAVKTTHFNDFINLKRFEAKLVYTYVSKYLN